jgi:hypothetical protein
LGCALEDFKEGLKDSDTTWHLVLGSDCALGGRKAAIDNAVCIIADWFNNVAMPPPPPPLQKLKAAKQGVQGQTNHLAETSRKTFPSPNPPQTLDDGQHPQDFLVSRQLIPLNNKCQLLPH